MKILDLLKMSAIVLAVTLLAGCNKSDDSSQSQDKATPSAEFLHAEAVE
jgi:outer membrane murein-binding lipoprotein Lpp